MYKTVPGISTTCKLLVEACGIQFPDQGSNPGPLHWEYGVSATEPQEKSPALPVLECLFILDFHVLLIHCCHSVSQSCPPLCDPMDRSTPGLSVPHHLLKFAQVHVHCIGDAIQPCHPLTPSSPFVLNLSQQQGLLQWSAVCIRWPKYWSFRFSISPSNEYSGLISLKIDWFDLLAV